MNRVIARFQDGRLVKGFTGDFLPGKDHFHLAHEPGLTDKPVEIRVPELKALFFVKTFEGDPQHKDSTDAFQPAAAGGRRIRVVFNDGEVIVGTTQGYDRSRPGFFVTPVDKSSNNERCFVVAAATQQVALI